MKKILVIAGPNKTKGKTEGENREALRTALSRIGFSVAGLFRDNNEYCAIDLSNETSDEGAIDALKRGYQQRNKKAEGSNSTKEIDPNQLMLPETYIGVITVGEISEKMFAYLSDIFPSRNRKGKIVCFTGYSNGDNAPLVVPPGYNYHVVTETTPTASHSKIRQVFDPTTQPTA
jgi:hypothetical protein